MPEDAALLLLHSDSEPETTLEVPVLGPDSWSCYLFIWASIEDKDAVLSFLFLKELWSDFNKSKWGMSSFSLVFIVYY